MDLYERLSRMLLRRKYDRVEARSQDVPPHPLMAKSKSMKLPRAKNPSPLERSSSRSTAPVSESTSSKQFTLRSSNNDVVDAVWFNNALRRSVAEGRLKLGSIAGNKVTTGDVR